MRIGINASGMLGKPSIERFESQLRTAAQEGFHSFWIAQATTVDALTVLAAVGRGIPGIELGTAVIPTFQRHPTMLAAQAMTAQALTEGRIQLGIGLSHKVVIEGMFGLSYDKLIRHMRDYLSILLPLLHERTVNFKGQTLSAHCDIIVPKDTKPCPVLLAALGPQMLRLAGSRAAGTVLWMVGENTVRDHIAPRIREAAEAAGRPAPRIVASLPICVTEDLEATRARADRAFAGYAHMPSYRAMLDREGCDTATDVSLLGSESQLRDRLHAFAEAGASDFSAVEFCKTQAERENTRALLRSFL